MEVVLMVHPYLEFRDAPGETEACLIFFLCCFVCVCVRVGGCSCLLVWACEVGQCTEARTKVYVYVCVSHIQTGRDGF